MNYPLVIFNLFVFFKQACWFCREPLTQHSTDRHRTLQSPVLTMATWSSLCSESGLHSVHVWGTWRGYKQELCEEHQGGCKQCSPHAGMGIFPTVHYVGITTVLEWVPSQRLLEIYSEFLPMGSTVISKHHFNSTSWKTICSHFPQLSIQSPVPQLLNTRSPCCWSDLLFHSRLFNSLTRICGTLILCQVPCFELRS